MLLLQTGLLLQSPVIRFVREYPANTPSRIMAVSSVTGDQMDMQVQNGLSGDRPMGLLIQPCELVRDDLAAGRLVEVLAACPVPSRPFQIFYAPDRRMTPKLRSFIDLQFQYSELMLRRV